MTSRASDPMSDVLAEWADVAATLSLYGRLLDGGSMTERTQAEVSRLLEGLPEISAGKPPTDLLVGLIVRLQRGATARAGNPAYSVSGVLSAEQALDGEVPLFRYRSVEQMRESLATVLRALPEHSRPLVLGWWLGVNREGPWATARVYEVASLACEAISANPDLTDLAPWLIRADDETGCPLRSLPGALGSESEPKGSSGPSWLYAVPASQDLAQTLLSVVYNARLKAPEPVLASAFTVALRWAGERYPDFRARLEVLRYLHGDAGVAELLGISSEMLTRFSVGDEHPESFPKQALVAAGKEMPSVDDWRDTVQAAKRERTEAPSRPEPTVDHQPFRPVPQEVPLALDSEPENREFEKGDEVYLGDSNESGVVLSKTGENTYIVHANSQKHSMLGSQLRLVRTADWEKLTSGRGDDAINLGLSLSALALRTGLSREMGTLDSAKVELKPHQVYVAWRVLQKAQARMILADEVGLGKTIEAGLVLQELQARGDANRVLLVVPASVRTQWQEELRDKFSIDVEFYDGNKVKALRDKHGVDDNPWGHHDWVLCTRNFASRPENRRDIVAAGWDVALFDEAHHVRRKKDGKETRAYKLAEDLSDNTDSILLLTATPLQLDTEELLGLIDLVEPGLFTSKKDYDNRRYHLRAYNDYASWLNNWPMHNDGQRAQGVKKHRDRIARSMDSLGVRVANDLCQQLDDDALRRDIEAHLLTRHPLANVMVRNRRTEIGISNHRTVEMQTISMTNDDRAAYTAVTDYIKDGFARAERERNFPVAFIMTSFQKMLVSSSAALEGALSRRRDRLVKERQRLRDELKQAASPNAAVHLTPVAQMETSEDAKEALDAWEKSASDIDDLDTAEAEYDDLLDEAGNRASAIATSNITTTGAAQEGIADRTKEIDQITDCLALLTKASDTKAAWLLDYAHKTFKKDENEKIIVFTQFIATQQYLADRLADVFGGDVSVHIYNGRQNAAQKKETVSAFKKSAGPQVFIATEAGAEGVNLQFAHILVNFDLPWNPMKIEQRIGRVDRMLQRREVIVQNLILENTIDERVRELLSERIQQFVETVGDLDPILGDKGIEDRFRNIAMHGGVQDPEWQALTADIERALAEQSEARMSDWLLDRNSYQSAAVDALKATLDPPTWQELRALVSAALTAHGSLLQPHPTQPDVDILSVEPSTAHWLGHMRHTAYQNRLVTFNPDLAVENEDLEFINHNTSLVKEIFRCAEITTPRHVSVASGEVTEPTLDFYYRLTDDGLRPEHRFIRVRWSPSSKPSTSESRDLPSMSGPQREFPLDGGELDTALITAQATIAEHTTDIASRRAEEETRLRDERIERVNRQYDSRVGTLEARKENRIHDINKAQRAGKHKDVLPAWQGQVRALENKVAEAQAERARRLAAVDDQTRTPARYSLIAIVGLVPDSNAPPPAPHVSHDVRLKGMHTTPPQRLSEPDAEEDAGDDASAGNQPGASALARAAAEFNKDPLRASVARAFGLPSADQNWEQGALGEQYVGALLDELDTDVWTVRHDVPLGRGNVDHILVGPPGVIVINTKHHQGHSVQVVGNEIRVAGTLVHHVPQVRKEAARVGEILTELHDLPVNPVPIIAVVGSSGITTLQSASGVHVVDADDLVSLLRRFEVSLQPNEMGHLAQIIKRRSTWSSTTAAKKVGPSAPATAPLFQTESAFLTSSDAQFGR